MAKVRHSEEKIIYAIEQVEAGTAVKEVCRQMAVSVNTYYQWKKKYSGLGAFEVRRLKHLVGLLISFTII